jgi:hypothetical protein
MKFGTDGEKESTCYHCEIVGVKTDDRYEAAASGEMMAMKYEAGMMFGVKEDHERVIASPFDGETVAAAATQVEEANLGQYPCSQLWRDEE